MNNVKNNCIICKEGHPSAKHLVCGQISCCTSLLLLERRICTDRRSKMIERNQIWRSPYVAPALKNVWIAHNFFPISVKHWF